MLVNPAISMGCDPELFVFDKYTGKVVPSSDLLPEHGINIHGPIIDPRSYSAAAYSRVVRDGVQVELNPKADTCRELIGYNISATLHILKKLVDATNQVDGTSYEISTASVIKMDFKDMKKMPKKTLEFGCKPSYNVYDPEAKVGVDGDKYPYRSGSGHIHLGSLPYAIWFNKKFHYDPYNKRTEVDLRERLVVLEDVFLGNTCVLLDRDPLQAERRKHYGRAGEYRKPDYGLEYRTLSNFWLRSYPLASFVFGMARYAVMVLYSSVMTDSTHDYEAEILSMVDVEKVREAIDTNNPTLAMQNFRKVAKFIIKHKEWSSLKSPVKDLPLTRHRLPMFYRFVKDVELNGLDAIFSPNIMEEWLRKTADGAEAPITTVSKNNGWEGWLTARYSQKKKEIDNG